MRIHGTLARWNDDRGFGFITPAQGGEEIFVHISAFPKDGRRPCVGELVSFETETAPNGKWRAIRVMRPGQRRAPRQAVERSRRAAGPFGVFASLLAIVAIGAYGYSRYAGQTPEMPAAQAATASPARPASLFKCDGRTLCSQMTSCAEATYFLQHCPNTAMDGNHDGEPCEQQWCH